MRFHVDAMAPSWLRIDPSEAVPPPVILLLRGMLQIGDGWAVRAAGRLGF